MVISRLFVYFVARKADMQSQGEYRSKVKDEGASILGARFSALRMMLQRNNGFVPVRWCVTASTSICSSASGSAETVFGSL